MRAATDPVEYRLSVPDPRTHHIVVELSVPADDAGTVLQLPAWIPGSYMIRDFARNILEITASIEGRAVAIEPLDKQTWRIEPGRGTLRVSYRVYAYDLSVRGAHVDDTHVFFNGSAVFFRVEGCEELPHSVQLVPGSGNWRVATSLAPETQDANGFGRYVAESYWRLIDHPVEIGDFQECSFSVEGVAHRVAITGRQRGDLLRILRDLGAVCRQHAILFGLPLPITQYLFLVTVVGDGYGGLEHLDSTSLICSRTDLPIPGDEKVSEGYRRFLGLCSHEYFHLWNVKRIRPARLTENDLSVEAYSELLWAFEGITSYYDDLGLARAAVIDASSYLELLARTITRLFRTGGRHRQSVAESSFFAWTKFYKQDENAPNAIVSYYAKGALVALGLDVTLRRISRDRLSLDNLMRHLWNRYGKAAEGVAEDGIEGAAAELVAGLDDADGLAAFFAAFVHGTEELPLKEWLGVLGVGMRLRAQANPKDNGGVAQKPDKDEDPAKPALGATFSAAIDGVKLEQITEGGAAQCAGLAPGDLVIAVDGLKVNADNLSERIMALWSGATVEIHAFRRDELRSFELEARPAPLDTCELWLIPDAELDDGTRVRRAAWLGAAGGVH